MSSVTIFFVLKEFLDSFTLNDAGKRILACCLWPRAYDGVDDGGSMLTKISFMSQFATRSFLPEAMDQEGVSVVETHQALAEIGLINRLLGGDKVILDALNRLQWPDRVVTIMDLGSGGGETLRVIADWAAKKKRRVRLIGIDRNPVMMNMQGLKLKIAIILNF